MYKRQVREIAQEHDLIVHDKKDSVGICFIGEKNFQAFLSHYLKHNPGDIVSESGQIIGQHKGLMYYTIGQRQGLGIGGVKNAPQLPWFVAAKDHKKNQLIAVQSGDNPLLSCSQLLAEQSTWISGEEPQYPLHCSAKTRYRQSDQECVVNKNNKGQLVVDFKIKQRAVTPGQSVVFYQGEECLGGAIIYDTDQLNEKCEFKP